MILDSLPWWMFLYPAVTVVLLLTIVVVARRTGGRGRRAALVISVSVTVIYLVWRAVFTIPTEHPAGLVLGLILYITEVFGAIQSFLFAVALWRPVRSRTVPLPAEGPYPSVDVLIATYNEPESTLRATLAAAASIRYPGTVVVTLCDDGHRTELAELAARYGARYLTRPDNEHAKAGNLNHALKHTTGELVVTLDADMVPRENLLEASVGLFLDDPNLGLVQAPQAFYNEDPFQYNLFSGARLPNEQDFFMRELQGGYERFNSTMYVGSNAIIRRTALEEIGGIVTGGLTEDFATGLQLQRKGIRIAYLPEIIAAGLAPEDVGDLLTQRDRWCRGAIQCGKRWNPFTTSGLSAMQRLIYADRISYWYFGLFKTIYLFVPIVTLLFGVPALVTDVWHLAVFWLPYYIASITSFGIVSGGRRSFTWSHIYEIAMAPAILVSALSETVGLSSSRFRVTPKGVTRDRQVVYWKLAAPHILYLVLAVVGIMNVYWWNRGMLSVEATIIPVAWTLYNMLGAFVSVLIFVQRPRRRQTERTRVDLPTTGVALQDGNGGEHPVHIADLSLFGAQVRTEITPVPASGAPFELMLPPPDGQAPTRGPAAPVAVRGEVRRSETVDGGQVLLGLRFVEPDAAADIRVMQLITREPSWVRHDREARAHLAGVSSDALRGIRKESGRR